MKASLVADQIIEYGLNNGCLYDEQTMCFSDGYHVYQLTDYSDGDFHSIIVKFSDIKEVYCELFPAGYNSIYNLVIDAFSDRVATLLEKKLADRRTI